MSDDKKIPDLTKIPLPIPFQMIPHVFLQTMFETAIFNAEAMLSCKGIDYEFKTTFDSKSVDKMTIGDGCRLFLETIEALRIETIKALGQGISK